MAFHHAPENEEDGLTALTIVHVANAFTNAGNLLADSQTHIEEVDYRYLERIGLAGHLDKWRRTCLDLPI